MCQRSIVNHKIFADDLKKIKHEVIWLQEFTCRYLTALATLLTTYSHL